MLMLGLLTCHLLSRLEALLPKPFRTAQSASWAQGVMRQVTHLKETVHKAVVHSLTIKMLLIIITYIQLTHVIN